MARVEEEVRVRQVHVEEQAGDQAAAVVRGARGDDSCEAFCWRPVTPANTVERCMGRSVSSQLGEGVRLWESYQLLPATSRCSGHDTTRRD